MNEKVECVLCYPPEEGENPRDGVSALARQLIHRKRQRAMLEALRDLVFYLHTIREERKAIVTVTQGWNLFREDHNLTKLRKNEPIPGVDRIRVGPDGKLTNEDKRNSVNALPKTSCDADRMRLSEMNNERFLREIIDDANRGNASFYMIDPRGLTVSDTRRTEAMIALSNNTDGAAVLNNNDLTASMRRIADDMSSYYLLGITRRTTAATADTVRSRSASSNLASTSARGEGTGRCRRRKSMRRLSARRSPRSRQDDLLSGRRSQNSHGFGRKPGSASTRPHLPTPAPRPSGSPGSSRQPEAGQTSTPWVGLPMSRSSPTVGPRRRA
jgi:hypothetical protein